MYEIREVVYVDVVPKNILAIMGADIGGTNSNFGIFSFSEDRPTLLISFHIKSQIIVSFADAVQEVVALVKNKYSITVESACFAVAGVGSERRDFARPTNLSLAIDAQEICKKASLCRAIIVNDFLVIWYGLELIAQKDLVCIKQGKQWATGNRAIVGAGTGLGKAIVAWDKHVQHGHAIASEGGHADFVAHTKEDVALVEFIQKTERQACPVSWEQVLSGAGIKRIYKFLGDSRNYNNHKEYDELGLHPDRIFADRIKDERCFATYRLFAQYYARCLKNFALDALAFGGVYVAGGIAARNVELFEQDIFQQEFIKCGRQEKLLRDMPVFVIADYNVSLYGAAQYLMWTER